MITTALELLFADGEYLFDLKLPQLAELQQKRGAGIFTIYGRVLRGRYMVGDQPIVRPEEGEAFAEDLFEVVRLALIGGGRGLVEGKEVEVTPITARTLVERYCHPRPLHESWAVAAAVLAARVMGYEDKKKEQEEEPAKAPRRKRSTSKTSSQSAPPSGSTGAS